MQIVIVDDNRDNLTVIGGLLKGEYHVRVANSGERALQVAIAGNEAAQGTCPKTATGTDAPASVSANPIPCNAP